MKTILYIHGMGGGGDSRIPSILRECLAAEGLDVVVRIYDFDPEIAAEQISSWVKELKPDLIIGESLGSVQAIRVSGIPHLFVSPSLNAPLYFGRLAFLALIPGVTWILDRIYRPKEGDRQKLHFTFKVLRKYRKHRKNNKISRKIFHYSVSCNHHKTQHLPITPTLAYDNYRREDTVATYNIGGGYQPSKG